MTFQNLSNFSQRLWVSLIGSFLCLSAILLSQAPYFRIVYLFLIACLASFALRELFKMVQAKGFEPLEFTGYVVAIAFLVGNFLAAHEKSLSWMPEITLLLGVASFFTYHFAKGKNPFVNIALTLFCLLYVAIPLGAALQITYIFPSNSTQDGRIWLIYLLVIAKATDMGAYGFGKKWGKTKLAPYISPKKTWEGLAGGCFAALIANYIVQSILLALGQPLPFSFWKSALFALVISLFAHFGDLAESLLKRDASVKDSSHLPGLGGLLDILDSLVFALPFLYIILKTPIGDC